MSRFVSNKTAEDLQGNVSVAKQLKAGTTSLGSIEKAVFKNNGSGWMELYFQAAEETEGLKNEKQPCGNPSYQYCKTSFSLSDKTLALDGNLNIINWLAYVATVIGDREGWDNVVVDANTNEELAEVIEDFFAGKEFVAGIQGKWKTINLGENDIDFCEPFLPTGPYWAANKDSQEAIDKLNAYVAKEVETPKNPKYPWILDDRVAIPEVEDAPEVTPTTGW